MSEMMLSSVQQQQQRHHQNHHHDKENAAGGGAGSSSCGKTREQLLQEWKQGKRMQKQQQQQQPGSARRLQGSATRVISEATRMRKQLAREIKNWGQCSDAGHMRRQFDKLALLNSGFINLADFWCFRSSFEQMYGELEEAIRVLHEGKRHCVGVREREQLDKALERLQGKVKGTFGSSSSSATASSSSSSFESPSHFAEGHSDQLEVRPKAPNTVAGGPKSRSIFGITHQDAHPTTPKNSSQRKVAFSTPRSLNLKGPAMRRIMPGMESGRSPGPSREVRQLNFDSKGSQEAARTVLTPVRATSKQKQSLGSSSVLTPVRRSVRKPKAVEEGEEAEEGSVTSAAGKGKDKNEQQKGTAGELSVREMLEMTDYSFAPNASLRPKESKKPKVVQRLFEEDEEEEEEEIKDEEEKEMEKEPPVEKETETVTKTPRRRRVAIQEEDMVETSKQVMVPVRLSKKAAQASGTDVALTPVRRTILMGPAHFRDL